MIVISKMKSGFISVVGRPNVGKSTLVNGLVGHKVAITTMKPQTTRNVIRGILTRDDAQLVFVDTPGIHKPHLALGNQLNRMAYHSLRDVEAIVLVVDASQDFGAGDQYLVDNLAIKAPLFIVFNKIDLTNFALMDRLKAVYQEKYPEATQIEVSSIRKFGFDTLIDAIVNVLPEGPQYFPSDMVSDGGDDFVIKEIIREKILLLTKEEIPHSVAVVIERKVQKDSRLEVYAAIIAEKDSQKGILIGKGAKMIRKIRLLATEDISRFYGQPIALELYVKVITDWRSNPRYLEEFGYLSENQ